MHNLSPSRRDALIRGLKLAAGVGLATASATAAVIALAESKGAMGGETLYGAAVRSDALTSDDPYRDAIAQQCQLVVPEGELKWSDLRPDRQSYRFEKADRIAAFARERRLGLRGHTLAWYGAMPAWTETIRNRAEAERELTTHIETVVSRYRGQIRSWDVVNEPIPEQPSHPGDLRPFVWTRHLAEAYIPIAFRAAASADPAAKLILNEYDVEFVGARFRARREALRRIALRLKDGGVPLHGIGLQAHLFADRPIDRDGLQSFVGEMHAAGLEILVTELDVIDNTLPGPPELRDALVAAKAYEFLDAVTAVARPTAIVTWGLTDRYTWVPTYFTRADSLPNRPLPFDSELRPKLLKQVIEHFQRKAA